NERGKWGLVGFHVTVKTAGYPGWVWATFEQVDNISTEAGSGRRPSYNNGTDDPPPNALGYDYNPKRNIPPFARLSERNPVQVTRLVPIPSTPRDPAGYSTADLNHRYRKLLRGTVWEYYELVGTQWSLQPEQYTAYNPEYNYRNYTEDLAGTPFPSQLSNTTMETYIQTRSSCIQCHYHAAALGSDFSWIMPKRAYPVR
ncbi:MAG: hypothetical protein QF645_07585, partial [Planctomycetota bacterium]|nr:hypothetical protein [Planctomycetota bacterium]